jgi:carbamoyltransferase
MKILGISCYYHDSAACLVVDGEIVAAAQEERFTRKKHDEGFPSNAVRYCLAEGAAHGNDSGLDAVVFYDKPLLKFHRILETYLTVAPRGLASYLQAIPIWLKEKLWIPPHIQE